MEEQQHEGHRGRSSGLVLSDLLMLDLVVAGLEGGEHDAVFSVLDAEVHQVFDQTDLRTEVPDTRS